MDETEDEKLPLHDEAMARSDWRGGETILERGGQSGGLPASEVDNAATPDQGEEGDAGGSSTVPWPGLRPPD